MSETARRPRLRSCVEAWPECFPGEYNPECCRFPKSCSCTIYDDEHVGSGDLEELPPPKLPDPERAARALRELGETAAGLCAAWAKREGVLERVTEEQFRDIAKGFMAGFGLGVQVIPPSGTVVRVATIELGTQLGANGSYELVEYGHLDGIPPRQDGTAYIVSLVAALAARGRDDLLAPYVEVRNEDGTMIGCRYLQRVC